MATTPAAAGELTGMRPVDMLPPVRTLAELQLGGSGVVDDVTGRDAMAIRLLEMGLVPGTTVRLLKRAPMGDPLQLQVRGYHLSLRKAEAARVKLRSAT